MGYDITIKNKDSHIVQFKEVHNIRGGTFAIGGTTEAWLSVTCNYCKFFRKVWNDGIFDLNGKTVSVAVEMLNDAIQKLKGEKDADYWKPTEGNARASLFNLKLLCEIAMYEYPNSEMTVHVGY